MPTNILFIRHGETDWNRVTRMQGHTDIELNDKGRMQAQRLVTGISNYRVQPQRIYSSDLQRAQATAAPTAAALGLSITPLPQWRERCYGIFEGLTREEIANRYPQDFARWQQHDPEYVVPDGESFNDLTRRIVSAFNLLVTENSGHNLMLVTHGGVLDIVYRHVNQIPVSQRRAWPTENCTLNHVRIGDNGQAEMLLWGDDAHLLEEAHQDQGQ